ncbi:hypothetical protein NC974_25250 [Leptolyngbya sp. SLC-A1]|uniref:hypothetical protein n=1 Tax=unclassified Leptolyngbya TaxID=2650499 RepID=UPI001684501E|nr:hypothetical protein [Leptolyngbya sp. FACHB-60]
MHSVRPGRSLQPCSSRLTTQQPFIFASVDLGVATGVLAAADAVAGTIHCGKTG